MHGQSRAVPSADTADTASLPDAHPRSDRFRCGARESKFLAVGILRDYGLTVVAIDAGMSVKDQFHHLREFLKTPPQFIFFSVERAANDGYLEYVLREIRLKVGLIVIDEAHCVSQWGHNFRPAYKEIPNFIDRIFLQDKKPPVLCLTATLNALDRKEICNDFGVKSAHVFQSPSLYRDNLELNRAVFDDENAKEATLEELLRSYRGQKVLVYVHRKKSKHGTSALDERFKAKGFNCGYFDADLDTDERTQILEQFKSGAIEIVFATGAFGMGIHIPDIRVVIHYLIPESIEQYYQEAGRAGRDGKPAFCHLLFTETNIRVRRDLINGGFPKGDDLQSFFDDSLIFKDDGIADLDPLRSLNETNLLSFHLLRKAGVLAVVCRGVARVKDFVATKTTPSDLMRYLEASITGASRSVSRKTNTPISDLMLALFRAYSRQELGLMGSPTKTLYIRKQRELLEADLQAILGDLENKKTFRLNSLNDLTSLIVSSKSMSSGIKAHLGI